MSGQGCPTRQRNDSVEEGKLDGPASVDRAADADNDYVLVVFVTNNYYESREADHGTSRAPLCGGTAAAPQRFWLGHGSSAPHRVPGRGLALLRSGGPCERGRHDRLVFGNEAGQADRATRRRCGPPRSPVPRRCAIALVRESQRHGAKRQDPLLLLRRRAGYRSLRAARPAKAPDPPPEPVTRRPDRPALPDKETPIDLTQPDHDDDHDSVWTPLPLCLKPPAPDAWSGIVRRAQSSPRRTAALRMTSRTATDKIRRIVRARRHL